MILAKLASAWGHLDDITCDQCDADPALKRRRGCGVAPRVGVFGDDGYPTGEEAPWTLAYFQRMCASRGWREDHEAAGWLHREVSADDPGGCCAVTGQPWPCCPRSFLRDDLDGHDPAAHALAGRILQLARLPESIPIGEAITTPLTPAVVDLLDLVERARNWREHLNFERMKHRDPRAGEDD